MASGYVDLISIFKEVFEQGLEVTRVYKFLHIVSKIMFYLVMAVFLNDFIFSLVPGLTISSQASVISALIIIVFTIALDLSFRT